LNNDESTNGGEARNCITIVAARKKFPMAELVTTNKALLGDGPDFHSPFNKVFFCLIKSKNMFLGQYVPLGIFGR
jgi:hypothetical protein